MLVFTDRDGAGDAPKLIGAVDRELPRLAAPLPAQTAAGLWIHSSIGFDVPLVLSRNEPEPVANRLAALFVPKFIVQRAGDMAPSVGSARPLLAGQLRLDQRDNSVISGRFDLNFLVADNPLHDVAGESGPAFYNPASRFLLAAPESPLREGNQAGSVEHVVPFECVSVHVNFLSCGEFRAQPPVTRWLAATLTG